MTQCKRLSTVIDLYLTRDQSDLSFATTLASLHPFVHQLDSLGAPARKCALDARGKILLARLDHTNRLGQWVPDQTLHLILDFLRQSDAAGPANRPDIWTLAYLFEKLLQARGFVDPHGVQTFYDSLSAASPTMAFMDTVGNGFWHQIFRRRYLSVFAQVDRAAPMLHGAYWYHTPGVTVSTDTWPEPGRISLLVTFADVLYLDQAAMLRRLAAQYGDQGLSITLVTKTQGYWLKNGEHTGPVSPAEEAVDDSAYYLGYLHLPVTLVVDSTSFIRDAEQRLRQATPVSFESAYGSRKGIIVLADPTGHVIVSDVFKDETRLSAYIKRALGH
jgi:hypothetical protein